MFKANGELFYPAFPDEPSYEDYISGENVQLPRNEFPGGGPSALAVRITVSGFDVGSKNRLFCDL
jgi:hypothetical protein